MARSKVDILHEAQIGAKDDWSLCFQLCSYKYEDETENSGYRFMWRKPNGKLASTMGQSYIPSVADIMTLIGIAMAEGWGSNDSGKLTDIATLNKTEIK